MNRECSETMYQLCRKLVSNWCNWQENRDDYLEVLQDLKDGECKNALPEEIEVIEAIKVVATEEEWDSLDAIVTRAAQESTAEHIDAIPASQIVYKYLQRQIWSKNYERARDIYLQNKEYFSGPAFRRENKGYYEVFRPDCPIAYTYRYRNGWISEHRLVISEYMGLDRIPNEYNVHHINGNGLDNRIENLLLMKKKDHMALHSLMDKDPVQYFRKVAELRCLQEDIRNGKVDFVRLCNQHRDERTNQILVLLQGRGLNFNIIAPLLYLDSQVRQENLSIIQEVYSSEEIAVELCKALPPLLESKELQQEARQLFWSLASCGSERDIPTLVSMLNCSFKKIKQGQVMGAGLLALKKILERSPDYIPDKAVSTLLWKIAEQQKSKTITSFCQLLIDQYSLQMEEAMDTAWEGVRCA